MKYIILLIVLFLLIILYIQRKRFLGLMYYTQWMLTYPTNTKEPLNKELDGSNYLVFRPEKGVGFSINGWIRLDNPDHNWGLQKEIFRKGTGDNLDMALYLDSSSNKLIFKLRTYNTINAGTSGDELVGDELVELKTDNLGIQKWNHIVINVFQDVIDIWINGTLVKSKRLNNIPRFDPKRKVYVLSGRGFIGRMSRWRFDAYVLDRELIKYFYNKNPDSFYFWDKLT